MSFFSVCVEGFMFVRIFVDQYFCSNWGKGVAVEITCSAYLGVCQEQGICS